MTPVRTSLLPGKVALVTGASRGIGAAAARAFAADGAAVVLAGRDEAALWARVAEISAAGGRALSVPTDVGDAAAVETLVERTMKTYGRLDAAFTNAAASVNPPAPLADVSIDDFDNAIAISLRGVFLAMRYEIPAMLESGGGAVVNMSSTAGLDAVAGLTAYVSSKHGVIALTKVAALDYAGRGVRVNAVAPGPILTDRLEQAGEEAQRRARLAVPVRRLGRPEEVAAAVVWLCSGQASYVTGATLTVDGGLLAGAAPFGTAQSG
jgi:NAD(P)-dependent dehydrogenase (short-subunit alcohol dehydrogenase family)